jgi:hypothetical protein
VKPVVPLTIGTLLAFACCRDTQAATAANIVIPPARVAEIAAMLPAKPAGFGRPISDRTAWEKIAKLPTFADTVAKVEKAAAAKLLPQPDELFLDYSRTGNRDHWQEVAFNRRGRVAAFTLAECFENRGRFLPPLEETISALCAEKTWVYPAHDGQLDNFNGRTTVPDLGAVFVAMELADADYVLGDRLRLETRRLIRENVRRRVLGPFRDMVEGRQTQAFWMRATHNWNAVCVGSITAAALALEDTPADRAFYLAAAERYIRFFLAGFTPDGYCSEGIGYWNYGFGHYILLSEAVRQATGGKLDLMADAAATQPALFCVRSEILNGIYPTIADCHPGEQPNAQFLSYVCRRFDLDLPADRAKPLAGYNRGLGTTLMLSFLEEPLPVAQRTDSARSSPLRTWFSDGGVLICRPAAGAPAKFAAALKGGHNAENHNHNDVGSFSVVAGKAMVICDPGGEVYTARTFGSRRYDSKVLNSWGHAVPVIAGQLQKTGADARARVLKTEFTEAQDTLALDIRSAYQVKELEKLERTFEFRRGTAPSLTVRDEVAFSQPQSLESALITWGKWEQTGERELVIRDGDDAVRVTIDTGGQAFRIKGETIDENVSSKRKPVRIGIALEAAVPKAVVTLRITPVN